MIALASLALLRLVLVALAVATSLTRAHRALVGRAYWSADMDPLAASWLSYQPATKFPPAADARGVITQRLPRGWVSSGRVIDVQVGAP